MLGGVEVGGRPPGACLHAPLSFPKLGRVLVVKASKWDVLCRKKEEEGVELENASQVRQGV